MIKKIILSIPIIFMLTACDTEPDKTICTESHTETKYEYHYGYNFMNGKTDFHFGPHTVTICDKSEHNKEWDQWQKRQQK